MSRYEVSAINHDHKVIVGWDRSLQTYFGIVYDDTTKPAEDNETGKIILWIGTNYAEKTNITDFDLVMRKYIDLDSESVPIEKLTLNII